MGDFVAGLIAKAMPSKERKEKLVREESRVVAAERGEDQLRVVEAYLSTKKTLDLKEMKQVLAQLHDEKMAETASMRSAERVATGSTDAARRAARLEEQLSAARSQLSAARGQLSTTLGELDGVLDADLAVADAALGNLSDEVLARLSGKTARLHRECLLEEARRSAAAAPRPGPTECVVCLERPREIAFDPCGHLAACETCSRSLGQCPICRRDVEARRRIFSS